MYARNYTPPTGHRQYRELPKIPDAEEILIPQNYHGEMMRPAGSRTEQPVPEETPALEETLQPSQVPLYEETPAPAAVEVPSSPPPAQTAQPRGGLLSGISDLLFGHGGGEDTLLLMGIGFLLWSNRHERTRPINGDETMRTADKSTPFGDLSSILSFDGDDLGLLLIVLLLLS